MISQKSIRLIEDAFTYCCRKRTLILRVDKVKNTLYLLPKEQTKMIQD